MTDPRQLHLLLKEQASSPRDRLHFEREAAERGFRAVAGVDEAGRGPLAGPVVAAAVILDRENTPEGLDDSKRLSPDRRDQLFVDIRKKALAVGVGIVGQEEIDRVNILNATLQAMKLAVRRLSPSPDFLLVDGITMVPLNVHQKTIAGGDRMSPSISAASIVAKVIRDRKMIYYHRKFPLYNFRSNKGYGTREHCEAIARYGCCPLHRKTFRRVREFVESSPLLAGN